jgi:hypothetical protein
VTITNQHYIFATTQKIPNVNAKVEYGQWYKVPRTNSKPSCTGEVASTFRTFAIYWPGIAGYFRVGACLAPKWMLPTNNNTIQMFLKHPRFMLFIVVPNEVWFNIIGIRSQIVIRMDGMIQDKLTNARK